jgi:hypothetical protein
MAFFNLTQLGPQNVIKMNKSSEDTGPSTSQENNDGETKIKKEISSKESDKLPDLTSVLYNLRDDKSLYEGSHEKYSEKRMKHQRASAGPLDMYKRPVASSHTYGWWMKDDMKPPSWSHNKRHVHVNSEMTRFVDEMSSTNKDFSLF